MMSSGHGTHVAGIIAATSGNARGVSGAAPAVVVMPVKVMDSQGNIWDTAVAEGIAWAVARGARVVNLSLGGDKASAAINAAVDNARGHGVVVVAAAGNNGSGVSQPGAYGPVLAVAAVEDRPASLDANHDGLRDGCGVARFGPGDYRHAPYSNVGPEVDIAAPGSCVLSTVPVASGRSYASLDGTSMATPFVSAAAALVLSRDPSLAAAQVEAALVGTAADIGTPGPDPETGDRAPARGRGRRLHLRPTHRRPRAHGQLVWTDGWNRGPQGTDDQVRGGRRLADHRHADLPGRAPALRPADRDRGDCLEHGRRRGRAPLLVRLCHRLGAPGRLGPRARAGRQPSDGDRHRLVIEDDRRGSGRSSAP